MFYQSQEKKCLVLRTSDLEQLKFNIRVLRNEVEARFNCFWPTVAAPLIAALNYWPLLNKGRKNRGLKTFFE